jgi:hypothetical protein
MPEAHAEIQAHGLIADHITTRRFDPLIRPARRVVCGIVKHATRVCEFARLRGQGDRGVEKWPWERPGECVKSCGSDWAASWNRASVVCCRKFEIC